MKNERSDRRPNGLASGRSQLPHRTGFSLLLVIWLLNQGLPGLGLAKMSFVEPLPKSELPESIAALAQWRRYFRDDETSLAVTEAVINQFLKSGQWSESSPEYARVEELKKTLDGSESGSDDASLQKRVAYHEAKQALKIEYNEYSLNGIFLEGAIADKDGRQFRWDLSSPTLLRISRGHDKMCYLELDRDKAIELKELAALQQSAVRPVLPEAELKVSADSRAAEGWDMVLSPKTVREFVEGGEKLEPEKGTPGIENYYLSSACDYITSYWFSDRLDELIPVQKRQIDDKGNYILGAEFHGSFAVVFQDKAGQLWRAELLNDARLRLEDSKGRFLLLELQKVLDGGSGQSSLPATKDEQADPVLR